jgi:molybdopterin/thiamine biosynthesis adenylyltransferase
MPLNTMRHLEVFDPYAFGEQRVDIIGCGATGSRVAISLAKLGIKNLHCWDFDKIEGHNVPNQAFGIDDIGKPKVEALKEMIRRQTEIEITAHNEAYEGQQDLGSFVFLLTDTMKSRKEIWDASIKYHPYLKLMIETRMGADQARVFAIDPNSPEQVKFWEGYLYGDEQATVSACGTQITVGPTAEILAGYATWTLIQWWAHKQGKEGKEAPQWDVLVAMSPAFTVLLPRTFLKKAAG